jgi:hypothetical protein
MMWSQLTIGPDFAGMPSRFSSATIGAAARSR